MQNFLYVKSFNNQKIALCTRLFFLVAFVVLIVVFLAAVLVVDGAMVEGGVMLCARIKKYKFNIEKLFMKIIKFLLSTLIAEIKPVSAVASPSFAPVQNGSFDS